MDAVWHLAASWLLEQRSLLPLAVFIVLDAVGYAPLWGERLHRRLLHHVSTGSFFAWRLLGAPLLVGLAKEPPQEGSALVPHRVLETVLKEEHVRKIMMMCEENGPEQKYFAEGAGLNTKNSFVSKMVGGQYSPKKTLYYGDFTSAGKEIMLSVGEALREPLARVLNVRSPDKFRLGASDFRCCLLRYEGPEANFGFHYDTEPWNCFRCLFLVKRGSGSVSPFLYKDGSGATHEVRLDSVGDGVVFQGSRIFHGTRKSCREDTVRYMLGFQYVCGANLESSRKSLCNQFRGHSSPLAIYMQLAVRALPLLLLKLLLLDPVAPQFPQLTAPIWAQLTLAVTVLLLFTLSEGARRLPLALWPLPGPELKGAPLEARLPQLQTQSTPRLLSCWVPFFGAIAHATGPDLVLLLTFAAYVSLTEHLLPASWVDVLYEDKKTALREVREHVAGL